MRAVHTAAVNVACLDNDEGVAAQCMASPLLLHLTALAACLLAAAPEGRTLCRTLLKVPSPGGARCMRRKLRPRRAQKRACLTPEMPEAVCAHAGSPGP